MAEQAPVLPGSPPPVIPFVTIKEVNGQIQLETNIPPLMKPLTLWLIKQAELLVLTKPAQGEIQPVKGVSNGLLRKLQGR